MYFFASDDLKYFGVSLQLNILRKYGAKRRSNNLSSNFVNYLSITVEEADESLYWLEIIEDTKVPCDQIELKRLQKEIDEITRILAKARKTNSTKP